MWKFYPNQSKPKKKKLQFKLPFIFPDKLSFFIAIRIMLEIQKILQIADVMSDYW